MFFETKVDMRSRKAMITFLTKHFRYDTMNSWNRSTSYAHCVKLNRLGLSKEQLDNAYEVLSTDFSDEISWPIQEFTREQNGCYTIGFNGRSSGYLVLYESRYEDTGHKSRCRSCGQLNFCKTFDPKEVAWLAEHVPCLRQFPSVSECLARAQGRDVAASTGKVVEALDRLGTRSEADCQNLR